VKRGDLVRTIPWEGSQDFENSPIHLWSRPGEHWRGTPRHIGEIDERQVFLLLEVGENWIKILSNIGPGWVWSIHFQKVRSHETG
jgi:hypothetical protein